LIRSGPSRKPSQWSTQHEGSVKYVEVKDGTSVLIVEDSLDRVKQFKKWLPSSRIVASASRAIEAIRKDVPQIIFLDRDLIGSFGEEVAKYLTKIDYQGLVICHSGNPTGAEFVKHAFPETQIIPFAMLAVVRIPREAVKAKENG
jgi:DNA-binding NtrC family response regulator